MENSTRLATLQMARALAALMVLVYHLMFIEAKYTGFDWLQGADWGRFGVDVFFAISGFIMVWTTRKQAATIKESARFLYRRALRIYPLYWLFTTAVLCVWLWRPEMVNSSSSGEPQLLVSYLLWPHQGLPLLAVGWSLEYELYFYLVFALLLLLPRRFLALWLCLWALVLLGVQGSGQSPWLQIMTSPLCFEFIGGALLACLPWREKSKPAPEHTPLLVLLGDASYAIYLSHVLVISLMGRLWHMTANTSAIAHALFLFGCVAAAALFGWLVHRHIEKPLMRRLRPRAGEGRLAPMYVGQSARQSNAELTLERPRDEA